MTRGQRQTLSRRFDNAFRHHVSLGAFNLCNLEPASEVLSLMPVVAGDSLEIRSLALRRYHMQPIPLRTTTVNQEETWVIGDCGGNLGPRRDREEDHMHGQERRRLATGTLVKFDHSYAGTIAELGYPTRSALRAWRDEHEGTGEVPASRFATNPKHAAETGRRAAGRHPGHGRGPAGTTGALGHPKGRERPSERADELAPGRRRHRGPRPRREATPPEGKVRVVAGPGAGDGSAAGMAERHGVPGTAPHPRHREMMGDSGGEPERKGEPAGRGSDDPPDGAEVSRDVPREAKTQPGRARPQPGARRVAPGWQEKTRAPTRGRRPTRRRRRWRRR